MDKKDFKKFMATSGTVQKKEYKQKYLNLYKRGEVPMRATLECKRCKAIGLVLKWPDKRAMCLVCSSANVNVVELVPFDKSMILADRVHERKPCPECGRDEKAKFQGSMDKSGEFDDYYKCFSCNIQFSIKKEVQCLCGTCKLELVDLNTGNAQKK